MKRLTVLWVAGMGILSLTLAVSQTRAAVDDATNGAINKIADLLEKGDTAGAKKAAKAVADKTDVEIFMTGFALRKKKGIGIGPKANEFTPDGIELKLEALVRDGITPANLKKEGPALTRAGYVIAAVSYIAEAKRPRKTSASKRKPTGCSGRRTWPRPPTTSPSPPRATVPQK